MKDNRVSLIFIISALAIGVLFYFLSGTGGKSKHLWQRRLDLDEKEPYDLHLLHATLRNSFGSNYNEIERESNLKREWPSITRNDDPGIYFFAGDRIYLTKEDIEILQQFMEDGGTVFISSATIPDEIFKQFPGLEGKYVESDYLDTLSVRFMHPSLQDSIFLFSHQVKEKTQPNYWQTFRSSYNYGQAHISAEDASISQPIVTLSLVDSMYPDFIYSQYGLGRLYLHTNPVFFSNLYLKKNQGRQYLAAVLKHLPNREIWVDRSARVPKLDAERGHTRKSVFTFIGENESLRYSWWILVGVVVLFLLMGGRRKQRPIPVLNNAENNSLGLVESLGYFYFTENKNALVFRREWNQFLNFIRLHLHIGTDNVNEEFMKKISEKSGVEIITVNAVFDMYNKYRIFTEISGEELMETNRTISKFYTEYYHKHGK